MDIKVVSRNWCALLCCLQIIANGAVLIFSRGTRGARPWQKRSVALFVSTIMLLATGAVAQSTIALPDVEIVDQNGVNLATGAYNTPDIDVQVGTAASGLTRRARFHADALAPSLSYSLYYINSLGQGQYFLNIGFEGTVYRFLIGNVPPYNYGWTPIDAGPYTQFGGGATLTCSNTTVNQTNATHPYFDSGTCSLRLADGTLTVLPMSSPYGFGTGAQSWTKPDGEVITVDYYPSAQIPGVASTIKAVRSSLGWMLRYDYKTSPSNTITITGVNTTSTYCDANDACTAYDPNAPQSSETISGNTRTIYRDGQLAYTIADSGLTRTITSSTGPVRTIAYTGSIATGSVQSVSIGGSTWSYSYSTDANYVRTATVTEPNGKTIKVVISASGLVTSRTDEAGRITKYMYDTYGRLTYEIRPDATYSGITLTGGYTLFAYDSHSNLTSKTVVPKDAGTDTSKYILSTATYPCAGPMTCNKPQTVTDTNGVKTTYTYDTVHGGILTETGAAPGTGGIARKVQYIYSGIKPQIKTATGYAAQPQVWRLTEVHSCAQGASLCNGAADDRMQMFSYGTDNNNPVNKNVLPVSTTRRTGNGTIVQTVAWTYDGFGRVSVEDGPASGTSDATYYFYDNRGRVNGTIGGDPDGAGARPRLAKKVSYDVDDKVVDTYAGTVTGTTASALNTMTYINHFHNDFSTNTGLLSVSKEYSGNSTTILHLTQYAYDNMGRKDCVAVRLNPVDYPSLPASACTQGTVQANGNRDQITKYSYALLGQVVSTISGYGTSEARTDFVKTYDLGTSTSTGTLTSTVDAKGNKTSYSYDKFNRLWKTCYPTAANGATSSTTDCAQVFYGTVTVGGASHVGTRLSSRIDRANASVSYGYDDAGQLKTISGAYAETYTFNNFGQPLTHTANGATSTYSYNALGWLLTDAEPVGTVSYDYDNLGRRIKMTWPSNDYVSYVYDDGNELLRICDGVVSASCTDALAIAKFGYDNYGRRTSLGRGSGYTDSYSYDTALRLQTLSMTASASTNSVTLGYSTADQIITRTQSNAAFNAPTPTVGTTSYSVNGLNQISGVGATVPTYDTRGNLTSDGATTFGYDARSRLVSASGGILLGYDASHRLLSYTASGVVTKFLYDGPDLIAEYNSSGVMLRRYVHGPNIDEPLVWFERNSGGTYDKRYFVADERGSVVAVTNASGVVLTYNSYDAFGVPTSSNAAYAGRFGYTGQAWLKELSVYYYRARMYAPTLRRFLQADPIGYIASMNMYAYVGNDPLNQSDPSGMCPEDHMEGDTQVVYVCAGSGGGFSGGSSGGGGSQFDDSYKYSSDLKQNTVQVQGCGATSLLPHGGGVSLGGEATAGGYFIGGTAKGSLSAVGFVGKDGANGAIQASGGVAANLGNKGQGVPTQIHTPRSVGAFIGGGISYLLTNAQSYTQLEGPFESVNISGGLIVDAGIDVSYGKDANGNFIWVVAVNPPYHGAGAVASVSKITTKTKTLASAGSGC